MRFVPFVFASLGILAGFQAAAVHPLVKQHVETLQAAQSVSIKLTDTEIAGVSDQQTLVLSKPNSLRYESGTQLIVANGTTLWKYDKHANSYEETPQQDGWEAVMKKEVPWMWSAFFSADFPKSLQSVTTGNKRKIKGQEVTEVTVTWPNNRSFTLFFDAKLGAFRGGTYSIGEARSQVNHMVVGELEIGTAPAAASNFQFAAPAGATKVDPNAPVVTNLTYADISPILMHSCGGCHGSANGSAGVNTSTYESLTSGSRPLVVPGKADASRLIQVTRSGRMPKGGRMSKADIDKIAEWINGGAKQ